MQLIETGTERRTVQGITPPRTRKQATTQLVNYLFNQDRAGLFARHHGRLYRAHDVAWIEDAHCFKAIGRALIDPDFPAFPYTINNKIYHLED